MKGGRKKGSVMFGAASGRQKGAEGNSVVKIAVPGMGRMSQEDMVEEYKKTVTELQSKSEPSLNDILMTKELYPFKSRKWNEKTRAKAKGDKVGRSLKQILAREPDSRVEGSYSSIETPRSRRPAQKFCDFTGFHAKYVDKKTGLRYYSHTFYPDICRIVNTVKNQYLELRNAVVNIK